MLYNRKLFRILLGVSIFLFPILLYGQSGGNTARTRDQIREAEAEIARIDQLLGTTRKEQGTNLAALKLIESKLENRQTIMKGLESEIGTVSGQIQTKSEYVKGLEMRIAELKRSYSALIRISYKNYKNNSFLSFIFSGKDFTDVSRRLHYVKRMAEELEKSTLELDFLSKELGGELLALNDRKSELSQLQSRQAEELTHLEEDKSELRRTRHSLRERESDLMIQAEKRRKQIAELERQLQEMVRAEMKRPGLSAGGVNSAAQLAVQFEEKKGNMLRPVEGVVVDQYGLHNHPTQKGVKINNKGVNIAAKQGAEVQSVFGGEVRKVFFFQGLGNSVMVRHGAYLTIYANLGEVFVSERDKVLEGQLLGTVAGAGGDQQATLHFEVWKESTNLNPEVWIKR